MKFRIIITTLLILAGIAFVSGAPTEKIGILAAKNNAIQFMDNTTGRMEFQNNFSVKSGDYYVFSSGKNRQYVNMRTGNVERADFPDSYMIKVSRMNLPLDNAKGIATAYAIAHYPNFTAKGMRLDEATLLDHGITKEYQFVWRQVAGNVITPNFVLIQINPETGSINSYIGIDREIEVPLTPAISREEAVGIASKSFPSIKSTDITAEIGVGYPEKDMQMLLWAVKIRGTTSVNDMQDGMAIIDAQTGHVYSMTT